MDEKKYKIAGEEFVLKDMSLADMERVQGLVPDEKIDEIRTWVNVFRKNIAKLFSIILIPEKSPDWYGKNLKAKDKVIDEVSLDFFDQYSPLQYVSKKVEMIR